MKIRKKEEEEEEKEEAPPTHQNNKVYKDLIWNYNPVQVWEWAYSPEWSGWLRVFYPQDLEMWNQVLTGMVWLWRKSKFSCCCSHLSFIGSTMKSWSLSSQLRVSVRDCRLLKVVYYYFFYSSLGHFIFPCKAHEWLCMEIVFCAVFPTVNDVYYIFMKTQQ